ncbi:MAG: hypothetical protein A3F72_03300 [Bacteroidetes bacterium RIFCSPLOWO2_12_FULL_35_15]|nr:MAG: hypothetical protein A3F72_03295 [Bacteroidetes bacterium RIFCSPLOWO2_12_FULL_35_15]OFY87011.1 MAG: hypothetical protein A3F72_03300 [Bacteroidetes bacterium RIFCSPLOWO2_12_FULL_35_15]
MTKQIATFAITVFSALTVYSQNDSTCSFSKHHSWLDFGLGFSGPSYINFDIGAAYLLKNKHAFQIDYLLLGSRPKENSLHNLKSVIVSYGINKSIGRLNSFILSAGLSYGQGIYYGKDTATIITRNWVSYIILPFGIQPHKYIESSFSSFGLYISGQYILRTRFYGVGIKVYCNIHKYTNYGVTISHNIGYLNKRRPKNNYR